MINARSERGPLPLPAEHQPATDFGGDLAARDRAVGDRSGVPFALAFGGQGNHQPPGERCRGAAVIQCQPQCAGFVVRDADRARHLALLNGVVTLQHDELVAHLDDVIRPCRPLLIHLDQTSHLAQFMCQIQVRLGDECYR